MNELKELGKKETMTSKEIAEVTGKEHKSVIRDIKVIIEQLSEDIDGYRFVPTDYFDNSNRKQPMYVLDKKACLLLASGYNVVLRSKIINRLEELENKMKETQLPTDYLSALKALVSREEQLLESRKQLEHQKPLVEFAEAVSMSVNSVSVGDFAKLLFEEGIQIGQNKLFRWLKENKYLMEDRVPYQKYMNSGYFDVIEQTYIVNDEIRTQTKTLITGKGQIYFSKKLKEL